MEKVPTPQTIYTIQIKGIDYLYWIKKSDKEEGIIIKLKEFHPKTKIYYEYEATTSKLNENIPLLSYFEKLDEKISAIKNTFDEGKAKFLKKEGKCYI